MTQVLAAPPVSLDGPLPVAPSYSLLQQAQVIDGDLRQLAGGAILWPYPTTTARLWAPCQMGSFQDKDLSEDRVLPQFAPFGSYLPTSCSTIDVDETELRERAIATMDAVESEAVERELANGEVQPGNPYMGDLNADVIAGGALAPGVALAMLERAIAATGRQGVIHADPGTVSAWAFYIDEEGQEPNDVLRTKNDTLIISGTGYLDSTPVGESAASPTQGWAYATGPLVIYRSPAQVHFSVDRAVNTYLALVERNYLVTWDTALQAAVLVDLTA